MNLQLIGMWRLADGAYLAHVGGSGLSDRYIFCYDAREIKFREKNSLSGRAKLFLPLLNKGALTERGDETVRVFSFGAHDCRITEVAFETAIKYATLYLVKTNGDAVDWLERPENIILDFKLEKRKEQ
jgi:hypothetical protein